MITTAQAIQTYWRGSLAGLTSDGLLWYQEAPSQPVTPYAVLIQVSEPETARTTGSAIFEGTYQINCMHDSLAGAESMANQVWDAFNGAQLVRTGQVMHCLAGETRSTLGEQMGVNGRDCWIAYVELEIMYAK